MDSDLQERIRALELLATGQAAMIALLSALLVRRKILSPQEAMLVATAGVDAKQFEGLTPPQVGEWIKGALGNLP